MTINETLKKFDEKFGKYDGIANHPDLKYMSCQKCEATQNSDITSYYRWKNANIEMRGCHEHLREIFIVLTNHQLKSRDSQT